MLTVQRLEALEAEGARQTVLGTPGAEGLEIMGGYAACLGAISPLTHVLGAGAQGPVTATDFEAVERFYAERGCDTTFELSPMADPTMIEHANHRGYRLTQFENTLVATLVSPPVEPGVSIRRLERGEHDAWSRFMIQAFLGREEVSDEEASIGASIAPYATIYVAEVDGQWAATGALWIHDEIGWFIADATRPEYRNRGLQGALIERRLIDAMSAGAKHGLAGTAPNSISQGNYLRRGFRVLYTKFTVSRRLG
jgi:GNAT superfamily N-acetyltransferase